MTSSGPTFAASRPSVLSAAAATLQNWLNSVLNHDDDHGLIQIGDLSAQGDYLLAAPTTTPQARNFAEIASSNPSGMRTDFAAAADSIRLATAPSTSGDGSVLSTASIDHVLAGWDSNRSGRMRRPSRLS